MNPSINRKYGKERLLTKYIEGDISNEEMHILNQYALEDDFLFDALEGLSIQEPKNKVHLQDLEKQLFNKSKNRRKVALYWLSAAASIAILIFAVNFINNSYNKVSDENIAMSEELKETDKIARSEADVLNDQIPENQSEDEAVNEESGALLNQPPVVEAEPEEIKTPEPPPQKIENTDLNEKSDAIVQDVKPNLEEKSAKERINALDLEVLPATETPETNAGIAASRKREQAEQLPTIINEVEGRVLTIQGEPAEGTAILVPGYSTFSKADQSGHFKLNIPEQANQIEVISTKFGAKKIPYEGQDFFSITLDTPQDSESLDGNTHEILSFSDSDLNEQFESYVNENINTPLLITMNNLSGFVIVKFDLLDDSISNVQIEHSFGSASDDEAQRLIRNFNWAEKIVTNTENIRVRIVFNQE